jgi:peptidyl-prolyl cis-trans isomerase C
MIDPKNQWCFRWRLGLAGSGVLLCLCLFSLAACTRSFSKLSSRVVVKVNDASLNAEDFSDLLAAHLKAFNSLAAKDSAVVAQAKNSIVQDFIVQTVTQDWAQKNQIFVRKETLDKEINEIKKNYPDLISFRKSLADQGLTFDLWSERVKATVLERQVLEALRKTAKPPAAAEIRDYYQANKNQFLLPPANHLRQIVVASENTADLVKKELARGKNFGDMAKKFSITPEGAVGGDLGWVERGILEIFDNTFKMGVGSRSGIVKSPFGYHIIELLARRPTKQLTLEEATPRITNSLLSAREQEIYSRWLEEQILKARVFKDDEFLKKVYVQNRVAK